MPAENFCPECWEKVPQMAKKCPHCDTDLVNHPKWKQPKHPCPECWEKVSWRAEKCPHCDTDLVNHPKWKQPRYPCPVCWEKVSVLAKKCPHCDTDLEARPEWKASWMSDKCPISPDDLKRQDSYDSGVRLHEVCNLIFWAILGLVALLYYLSY